MRKPTRSLRVQRVLFGTCCSCGGSTSTDTILRPRRATAAAFVFAGIVSAQHMLLATCSSCASCSSRPTLAELCGNVTPSRVRVEGEYFMRPGGAVQCGGAA